MRVKAIECNLATLKRVLVSITDITVRTALQAENVELERHLRRAQKLETIGVLAGGIAHDFNNILTPIMGYAEMAASKTEASDPLHADLERILGAAQRAKDLVERILLFSRQTEKARKPVKIQLIAHEAIQLLRSSIPATISINEQIDPSCDWVMADETQIHEVIVNLCTNAYHAIEDENGAMTIGVEQLKVNAETAGLHPNLAEAEYVRISVRDTGAGMGPAIVDRIFEPFYTTKSVGKGSGMGLAVVHGIVHSHDGEVLVHSAPGEGSLFEVYLPVTTEAVHIEPEQDHSEVEGGRGSIMVVDDDPAVANVVTAMVESLGYKVTSHTSSTAALEEITQHQDRYQLIISDLTMPDLSGIDLSEQLSCLDKPVPIMIMTGYGENLQREACELPKVIAKPVAMKALATAIREMLDNTKN